MNTILALTQAAPELPIYAVPNPFDGVNPNPRAFGDQFNNLGVIVLGGLWGLVLLVLAGRAILALSKWAAHSRAGYGEQELTSDAQAFKVALLVFGIAIALPLIFGGVIFLIAQA